MAVNVGSAYGVVDIDTGKAKQSVLGLQSGIGGLRGGLLGLNPVLGATKIAFGGVALAGGGLVATIGTGVGKASQLQSQLSGVKAVTGATSDEVAQLRGLIDDLSLDEKLKVDAFEAADAIELLGRNGLKVEQIMGGAAEATVLLANATGADFGPAADTATDTMAIFNIKASEMTKAVDGITSVVNNSKFGFDDFRLALAQGGGVAGAAGVEFEDFTTSIAGIAPLFASGSDAGTSFKVFLQRLIPQSDAATGAMKRLGIITEDGKNQFFDANGQLRSMADISKLLNGALSDLSEEQRNAALSTIFGTDAQRAAVGLMELGAESADGLKTNFEALQAAMGETSAAENAATRIDNLSGSIEILRGVMDAIILKIGEQFLPIVNTGIQQFTSFLKNNSDTIVSFFALLAQGTQRVQEFMLGLLEAVTNGFNEGGISGAVDAFWVWVTGSNGVIASAPDILNQVVDFLIDVLGNQWPRVANALMEWGDKFWGWIEEVAVPRGVEELNKLGVTLQQWAESEGGSARLQALGNALADGLILGMQTSVSNTDRLVGIISSLAVGLVGALPGLVDAFLSIGKNIAAGVFSGVFEYVTGDQPKDETVTVFASMWEGVMQALITTFVPVYGLSFAKANFDKIRESFQGFSWAEIGRAIAEGIAVGLTSGASAIAEAARSAASDALKGAKSLLGINSPSSVARDEVGAQFSAGVAQGITDNLSSITSAQKAALSLPSLGSRGGSVSSSQTNNNLGGVSIIIQAAKNPRETAQLVRDELERLFDSSQGGSYAYG